LQLTLELVICLLELLVIFLANGAKVEILGLTLRGWSNRGFFAFLVALEFLFLDICNMHRLWHRHWEAHLGIVYRLFNLIYL